MASTQAAPTQFQELGIAIIFQVENKVSQGYEGIFVYVQLPDSAAAQLTTDPRMLCGGSCVLPGLISWTFKS